MKAVNSTYLVKHCYKTKLCLQELKKSDTSNSYFVDPIDSPQIFSLKSVSHTKPVPVTGINRIKKMFHCDVVIELCRENKIKYRKQLIAWKVHSECRKFLTSSKCKKTILFDLIADDCSIIATKWQNKTVDLIVDKVGAKYWDTFFGTKWDLTPNC